VLTRSWLAMASYLSITTSIGGQSPTKSVELAVVWRVWRSTFAIHVGDWDGGPIEISEQMRYFSAINVIQSGG